MLWQIDLLLIMNLLLNVNADHVSEGGSQGENGSGSFRKQALSS
jgi:hypothetical protein